MAKAIGALVAYLLIKQLSTDWEDWEIYKLGLIDDKGQTIRKAKTPAEKKAMNIGVVLAKNIKKLLERIPFGKSKLASLVAALYLIKENEGVVDDETFDTEIRKHLNIGRDVVNESEDSDPLLEAGKYMDEEGNLFIVKEEQQPLDTLYGFHLYEVFDVVTRQRHIITKENTRKV